MPFPNVILSRRSRGDQGRAVSDEVWSLVCTERTFPMTTYSSTISRCAALLTLTDAALRPQHSCALRSALAGGQMAPAYLRQPQGRRVALERALGIHGYLAGVAVTTVAGRWVFVSIAQAIALLVGGAVDAQLPRLSRALPILDRLPTDLAVCADQVVYAIGVNQVLPMAARLRWRWSDGQEERPVAAMTTEEACAHGFQLRARASLPRLQAVDPAWLLASCGVCVGVRRGSVVSWEGFLPLAALAQALIGRVASPPPLATAAD